MKNNLIVTFLLLISINLSSNELAWVDEQVEAIKPARKGESISDIEKLADPFIFLQKNKSPNKEDAIKVNNRVSTSYSHAVASPKSETKHHAIKQLVLVAVINKSALINDKWYRLNDKIGKYVITDIDRTSVVLTDNHKSLVLSTNSQNKTLKFNNK
ncbi:hypothetical protein KKG72_08250 [bacterium]|nr:hypothetical protein [bacterium]MBU1994626.1 hypothetical protein [bacterium]